MTTNHESHESHCRRCGDAIPPNRLRPEMGCGAYYCSDECGRRADDELAAEYYDCAAEAGLL